LLVSTWVPRRLAFSVRRTLLQPKPLEQLNYCLEEKSDSGCCRDSRALQVRTSGAPCTLSSQDNPLPHSHDQRSTSSWQPSTLRLCTGSLQAGTARELLGTADSSSSFALHCTRSLTTSHQAMPYPSSALSGPPLLSPTSLWRYTVTWSATSWRPRLLRLLASPTAPSASSCPGSLPYNSSEIQLTFSTLPSPCFSASVPTMDVQASQVSGVGHP